jgi:hypothetical protein
VPNQSATNSNAATAPPRGMRARRRSGRTSRSAATTTIVKIVDRPLWRIQLPVADNKGTVFSEDHHNIVRKMVLKISGGLTDNLAAHGEWIEKNKLYSDRNIRLDLLATCGQAEEIAAFAREHYRQKAIFYCVISNHVRMATRKKARWAGKKPHSRRLKRELAPQTVRFEREAKSVAVHGFSSDNSFSALKEWARFLRERGAAQLRELLGVSARTGAGGRAVGMNKGKQQPQEKAAVLDLVLSKRQARWARLRLSARIC